MPSKSPSLGSKTFYFNHEEHKLLLSIHPRPLSQTPSCGTSQTTRQRQERWTGKAHTKKPWSQPPTAQSDEHVDQGQVVNVTKHNAKQLLWSQPPTAQSEEYIDQSQVVNVMKHEAIARVSFMSNLNMNKSSLKLYYTVKKNGFQVLSGQMWVWYITN